MTYLATLYHVLKGDGIALDVSEGAQPMNKTMHTGYDL